MFLRLYMLVLLWRRMYFAENSSLSALERGMTYMFRPSDRRAMMPAEMRYGTIILR